MSNRFYQIITDLYLECKRSNLECDITFARRLIEVWGFEITGQLWRYVNEETAHRSREAMRWLMLYSKERPPSEVFRAYI